MRAGFGSHAHDKQLMLLRAAQTASNHVLSFDKDSTPWIQTVDARFHERSDGFALGLLLGKGLFVERDGCLLLRRRPSGGFALWLLLADALSLQGTVVFCFGDNVAIGLIFGCSLAIAFCLERRIGCCDRTDVATGLRLSCSSTEIFSLKGTVASCLSADVAPLGCSSGKAHSLKGKVVCCGGVGGATCMRFGCSLKGACSLERSLVCCVDAGASGPRFGLCPNWNDGSATEQRPLPKKPQLGYLSLKRSERPRSQGVAGWKFLAHFSKSS
jgi:hypothetical protein